MELKAIKEYKSPEYPTVEESKNRILMMMVRTGKISLGVAVMCLLCNCSLASIFPPRLDGLQPYYSVEVIDPPILALLLLFCSLGSAISLFLTIFFLIKNHKLYKLCEDSKEKELLKKRRNKNLIKGGLVIIIFIVFFVILGDIQLTTRQLTRFL